MNINKTHHSPTMTRLGTVKFGSLIRVHDVPNYWPHILKNRNGRFGNYFLLTSEYYRSHAPEQQLIIDVSTGEGIGLKPDHLVEVILNAEVVLNENHYS